MKLEQLKRVDENQAWYDMLDSEVIFNTLDEYEDGTGLAEIDVRLDPEQESLVLGLDVQFEINPHEVDAGGTGLVITGIEVSDKQSEKREVNAAILKYFNGNGDYTNLAELFNVFVVAAGGIDKVKGYIQSQIENKL